MIAIEDIERTERVQVTDVVKSVSIENMVNQRAGALERLQQAATLIEEALTLCSAAQLGSFRLVIDSGSRRESFPSSSGIEELRKQIDAGAWQYLLHESGLRSFMDAKARQQWNDQIAKCDVPELTTDTVAATFHAIHGARQDMFERGVVDLFRQLARSEYKSNSPWKFGPKVIVNHLLTVYGSREWFAIVNHCATDALDDLVRVLSVLDGCPEPDHRNGVWQLVNAARHADAWECEHRYFHLRWFKKGSGHLTFTPAAPLDKLNTVLARQHARHLAQDKR